MERAALSSIIDKVQPGSKLRLTFKRGQGRKQVIDDDMAATLSFFGLMDGQNLIFEGGGMALVLAVVESRYWDSDQNRTFTVTVPEGFDRNWFEKRLCDGLEKVEILP